MFWNKNVTRSQTHSRSGHDPRMAGSVIPFTVHSWSSYSPGFYPDAICENKPSDGRSRWLSEGSKFPQYLVLKLERPAVVQTIMFGKCDKTHSCNLKKFQVSGGMDCEHMQLLFTGGLKNNSELESFPLRCEVEDVLFPCQYIKILPLQSWSHGFNFAIWYVELRGVVDEGQVQEAQKSFQQYLERQAVRLCLKHLRQHDYPEAFEALQKKAKVQLEHPMLTQLHSFLVEKGDFEAAERVVEQASEDGFLDEYVSRQPVEARWTPIESSASGGGVRPGMRGGHQVCIDPIAEMLYLYGGWDGSRDLGDFWKFDVKKFKWTCLCQDTSLVGGPSPRSCHKMCLDVEGQLIYILGRYLDPTARSMVAESNDSTILPSDFYSYCIDTNTWSLVSADTYSDGGPRLIFDHQMCYDPSSQTIYVFGGRVLSLEFITNGSRFVYSGLYAYHTTDKQWICLRPDYNGGLYLYELKPRMAHTMLFYPQHHQLIVMGGQRDRLALSDMLVYNVLSDETIVVADGKETHIPASGVTIRTTLDPHRDEICLLTGLNKFAGIEGHEENKSMSNSLWVYDLNSCQWCSVSQGTHMAWHHALSRLPSARYAHQFIYDPLHQTHYMFGGNPDDKNQHNMRLDDFWKLKLVRHSKEQLLRHCQFAIRKQRFDELALEDPVKALSYLQTNIAAIVNHDDSEESTEFRRLTSTLFTTSPPSPSDLEGQALQKSQQRNELYSDLCSYWPEHMTQPTENITELLIDKL